MPWPLYRPSKDIFLLSDGSYAQLTAGPLSRELLLAENTLPRLGGYALPMHRADPTAKDVLTGRSHRVVLLASELCELQSVLQWRPPLPTTLSDHGCILRAAGPSSATTYGSFHTFLAGFYLSESTAPKLLPPILPLGNPTPDSSYF